MSIFDRMRSGKTGAYSLPRDSAPRVAFMRMDGKKYLALPPVDRTSYVVGALDMLSQMIFFTYPEYKPNMEKLEAYANKHASNNLRLQFDEFMAANPGLGERTAASNFMTFLNEKAK